MACRIFLALKFNGEITSFSSYCVRGVKCSGGINKKSGAANLAMLVNTVDLDHSFGRARKNLSHMLAGGLILREEPTGA